MNDKSSETTRNHSGFGALRERYLINYVTYIFEEHFSCIHSLSRRRTYASIILNNMVRLSSTEINDIKW